MSGEKENRMEFTIKTSNFGQTSTKVPPIIFGTSCLGNLYQSLTYETKLEIVSEWFKYIEPPVVLDTAGKYGAGLALETIGRTLRDLNVSSDEVLISNKLGWKRIPLKGSEPTFEPGVWVGIENDAEQAISYNGILGCFAQGNNLLGEKYKADIVSVHDPDEYIANASGPDERRKRHSDILQAYIALLELKDKGKVKAVGVGAKDWEVIKWLSKEVDLDWVMFACSLTVYTHPNKLLEFMEELKNRNIAMVNSAVFNAGFLAGGNYFNYKKADPVADSHLFNWRHKFFSVCKRYNVKPAAACIQFGLSVPGVVSVALNSSKPSRVRDNVKMVTTNVPADFWVEMKKRDLISKDYPYLG
jgi:D-threo-aldose 1-dehydrogenase